MTPPRAGVAIRPESRRRTLILLASAAAGGSFAGVLWWSVGSVEPVEPSVFHVEQDGVQLVCVETPDNLWCE